MQKIKAMSPEQTDLALKLEFDREVDALVLGANSVLGVGRNLISFNPEHTSWAVITDVKRQFESAGWRVVRHSCSLEFLRR